MAYDAKFRERVIRYKDSGHTFAQVNEAFGVDPRRYYEWKKQLAENGKFENHYPAAHSGKIDPEKLRELVREHPHLVFERVCGSLRRFKSSSSQKVCQHEDNL
jgi:hypothetical protein